MKKKIVLLLVSILLLVGCSANEFKNPKTITTNGVKGQLSLKYEDDSTFEYVSNVLMNRDGNFRLTLEYGSNTVERQETLKNGMLKNNNYDVNDVMYNNYEGYVVIDKKYATATVVLYIDKKKDVIAIVRISPVQSLKAKEEIDKGKKPKDVLFNNKKVQQSLGSISFKEQK